MQVLLSVAIASPQVRARVIVSRLSLSKSGTKGPVAMPLSHGQYKEDPEYSKEATHLDDDNYGPHSSPPSDCNSLPLRHFLGASLSTIIVMRAIATLVWRFYTPPPLVL